MPASTVRLARLIDLEAAGRETTGLVAAIDAVFFEAATRRYEVAAARAAFQQLWLGQYLALDRDKVHVAVTPNGDVAGYLVGCFDNPAGASRFAALTYFEAFAPVCIDHPAHLHINLTAAARGLGIGRRLVDAFCAQAAAAGLAGVHVVTAPASRNVRFYERAGFVERAQTTWNDHPLVFLGRRLAA